ncbi:hypothetical protein NP493_177g01053 [Ridgeia piscesae]|uniref:VWFA domain-containing protein n=1 Tax=Ridgeia piscesae TaxID=27915 RepID=A0AAD9P2W6_RIDPI|nr:hypothetical protein NP493_177g01053 [Ridgeia piscesae]
MSHTFLQLLFLLVALAALRAGGQQMFNPKLLGRSNHGPGRFGGIYVGGEKRYAGNVILPGRQLNAKDKKEISKVKVEHLGEMLKRHVENLRRTANRKAELVFLVDSSASVGAENFFNELKFVKKLLADFTVDRNTTRVCVVTFSSRSRVVKHIDHLSRPDDEHHKCSLLEEELPQIQYTGGGTYTLGAFLEAQVRQVLTCGCRPTCA